MYVCMHACIYVFIHFKKAAEKNNPLDFKVMKTNLINS